MIERRDEVLAVAKKVLAQEAKAIHQMIDLVGQNFLQAVDPVSYTHLTLPTKA